MITLSTIKKHIACTLPLAALACGAGTSALAQAPGQTPVPAPGGGAVQAVAPPDLDIVLDVEVGEPVMLAGRQQKAYVKIGLTGFDLPAKAERAPINMALVIDRSSSMTGDKFERAKEAAMMVVDRLGDDDIISVITYDSTVDVLVPATKVVDRSRLKGQIGNLRPRGATALFAGVSYGIEEVQKFLSEGRVNRIVLLSDGQANVGPSSPNELGRLGASAAKLGMSITTIGLGLGYNEDLMVKLAMASDGNHAFAENADELATIFNHELGDVLSVVAKDVTIEVIFDGGVKPLRGLNRSVEIHGNRAVLSLGQLYAKQEKYFLIEVDVPAAKVGLKRDLADVRVGYNNVVSKRKRALRKGVGVRFVRSATQVAKNENHDVMVAAVEAIATDNNRRAVALRDSGKVKEAQKVLVDNARNLEQQARRYNSDRLKDYGEANLQDSENLEGERWNRQRKAMRKQQVQNSTNQAW